MKDLNLDGLISSINFKKGIYSFVLFTLELKILNHKSVLNPPTIT